MSKLFSEQALILPLMWHRINHYLSGEGEGVVARWCNPLILKSEQSGGLGSSPDRIPPLEGHDKESRTRLGLLFLRSQHLALKTTTSPSPPSVRLKQLQEFQVLIYAIYTYMLFI